MLFWLAMSNLTSLFLIGLIVIERKRAREKLAAVEAEWEDKLNKVIWADHLIYGDEEVDAMKAEIASLKRSLEHAYWTGQQALAAQQAMAAGGLLQQNMAAGGLLQQNMLGQYRSYHQTCVTDFPKPLELI